MLATALEPLRNCDPFVLGLARGGMVLASVVSKRLKAPLDVLVCKKVGLPRNPELAIGAVAPGGARVMEEFLLESLGVTLSEFDRMATERAKEIDVRLQQLRGDRPFPDLAGRAVVIVDDGLATGSTALSAVRFVREFGPAKIVVAAPVCSNDADHLIRREGVDLVCISEPTPFHSVSEWYEIFDQIDDEQVIRLLNP